MKKLLLVTAAMFAATMGFAQQIVEQSEDMKKTVNIADRALQKAPMAPQMMTAEEKTQRSYAKKTVANGLYYYRPEGTMWYGETEEAAVYSMSYLVVPAWTDIVFENGYTNPTSTSWYINGTDYSEYADDNGDYNYGQLYYNGYMYYLPTLTYGSNTFAIGEWNTLYDSYGYGALLFCDTVTTLAFQDCSYYNDVSKYGFGGVGDNSWLYGPGSITSGGVEYTCYAIEQYYPKPASPLYIEYVYANVYSNNQTPIEDGTTLNMYFYNNDWTELLGTLQATADDCTYLGYSYTSSYTTTGEVYMYNVRFAATGTDVFGNSYTEPLTVTDSFNIMIDVPEEGINFGFLGQVATADDRPMEPTVFDCADSDGNAYGFYYTDTQINLNFMACFDYVECPSDIEMYTDETYSETAVYSDMNQLMVSDDGETVYNVGMPDIDYAFIYAAFDYVNQATGDYEYTYDDLPDWVNSITIEDTGEGYFYVTVDAQALPDDVENRAESIYLYGKGYTSTMPIKILQGDGANGISSVKVTSNNTNSDDRTYNIAGQQVDNTYKGLVIKNGNKFIRK